MLRRITNRLQTYRRWLAFRSQLINWREVISEERRHHLGVTLRHVSGATIRGGTNDDTIGIYREIFVEKCYTPSWFYSPQPAQVVLDVGANIGIFSLFLHIAAPGIRVLAFEPHPATYQRLVDNLTTNNALDSITPHQIAVSSGPGEVRFAAPSSDAAGQSGHYSALESNTGFAVPCIGLSDAVTMAGGLIDLLKVDTEGAEAEIITTAPEAIWTKIARVVVEYHDLTKRDQVEDYLKKVGYRCRVVPAPNFEHHLGLIYATKPG